MPNLRMSATEQLDAFRAGTLTPSRLLEKSWETWQSLQETMRPLIASRYEAARFEALRADAAYRTGTARRLEGLLYTVKDGVSVAGMPWSLGVTWRKDVVATADAAVVRALNEQGAILIGVTNIPDLALWFETQNKLYGTTVHPMDSRRTPGGSSGGEAVMVQTGCSSFGIGSDLGGSIRIPAAFCGLYGFKPSAHVIPSTGHWPCESETDAMTELSQLGPLARTLEDVGLVLGGFLEDSRETVDLTKTRAFVLPSLGGWGVSEPSAAASMALADAVAAMQRRGVVMQDAPRKVFRFIHIAWAALLDSYYVFDLPRLFPDQAPALVLSQLIWGKMRGRCAVSDPLLMQQISRRIWGQAVLRRMWQRMLDNLIGWVRESWTAETFVLSLPQPGVAPLLGDTRKRPFDFIYAGWANLLGAPSLALPWGRENGLPLGIMVTGTRGFDRFVLNVGHALAEEAGTLSSNQLK